jgi:hypothetical protein
MSFLWELFRRALDASVASMGTTLLALFGALVVTVVDFIIQQREVGAEKMKHRWREFFRVSALVILWWGILLSYWMRVEIRNIRQQAASVTSPVVPQRPPLPPSFWAMTTPCELFTVIKRDIVARVFARGISPKLGETVTIKPNLQELFYEWQLELIPSRSVSGLEIDFRYDKLAKDRIRSVPDAAISEPKPRWMSGFDEPARPADYYVQSVRFAHVLRNQKALVIIRHAIKLPQKSNKFAAADFDRSFDLSAPICRLSRRDHKLSDKEFANLMFRAATLGMWKYSGPTEPPPQTIRDPDEPVPPLAANEVESSVEVRCQDDTCKRLIVKQLEARRVPH